MRVAPLLALPFLAAGPATPTQTKPVFSAAMFAPLATTNPDARARWSWPPTEAFHATWTEGERAARPIRLVRGKVGDVPDVVLALVPIGDAWEVDVLFARGDERPSVHRTLWTITGTLAPGAFTLTTKDEVTLSWDEKPDGSYAERRGQARLAVEATYVSPDLAPTGEAFSDWIYATTLAGTGEPVYAATGRERGSWLTDAEWAALEAETKRDTKAALAAIERRLEKERATSDARWETLARFAVAHDPQLARRIYRVYRPVGQCSMDTRPAEVAREYAELCYRLGDLGCYVQLSVQIMGNQFDRTAWGSYAEGVHLTQAEKLAESGLDVDRFLLGLATVYGAEKPRERELGTWRLARSVREAGRAESLVPLLEKRAEDPALDEMNRLRATMILAWLEFPAQRLAPAEREKVIAAHVARLRALEKRSLSPVSRAWVEHEIRRTRD